METLELVYDKIIKETEEAKLIKFGDKKVWVPKSIIEEENEHTIEIEEWFVLEYELEGYEV